MSNWLSVQDKSYNRVRLNTKSTFLGTSADCIVIRSLGWIGVAMDQKICPNALSSCRGYTIDNFDSGTSEIEIPRS